MASEAEVRAALTWETGNTAAPDKSVWAWLWEAIQGDFNEHRSTGQIAFDAGISMIPVIDQICDVRDIIANCKDIAQSDDKADNTWKYIALGLTLIGLFPSLGSLVKGVLKILFAFIRRTGLDHVIKAADHAMTWIVTFLRKREVQRELKRLKVDEVFSWLAKEVKNVKDKINPQALLSAFDRAITTLKGLLQKVTWLPGDIGKKAQATITMVENVRKKIDNATIGKAVKPIQDILDHFIRRLEKESLIQRAGILDTKNIHFRGTLPEAQAVALMRRAEPLPPWLSKERNGTFGALDPNLPDTKALILKAKQAALQEAKLKAKKLNIPESDVPVDHWPALHDGNIASFHKMTADVIKGPAKLYRVGSPSSGAMGDCWVSEAVFNKIMASPDPKTVWRKHLAVWPNWNANGQYFTYELKAGEELKVWRGPASTQKIEGLDAHLEGGWEQIIFKANATNGAANDTIRYYKLGGGNGTRLEKPMSKAEVDQATRKMSGAQRGEFWRTHTGIREKINDPRITGPLDTHWGMTDFDVQLDSGKIGLPNFAGQITN